MTSNKRVTEYPESTDEEDILPVPDNAFNYPIESDPESDSDHSYSTPIRNPLLTEHKVRYILYLDLIDSNPVKRSN